MVVMSLYGVAKWIQTGKGIFIVDPIYLKEFMTLFSAKIQESIDQ